MPCLWDIKEKQYNCKYCVASLCDSRIENPNVEEIATLNTIEPPRGRDEIDEWLEKECHIHAGCCSSIESLRYNVGREVAEKLWNKNNGND